MGSGAGNRPQRSLSEGLFVVPESPVMPKCARTEANYSVSRTGLRLIRSTAPYPAPSKFRPPQISKLNPQKPSSQECLLFCPVTEGTEPSQYQNPPQEPNCFVEDRTRQPQTIEVWPPTQDNACHTIPRNARARGEERERLCVFSGNRMWETSGRCRDKCPNMPS